MQLKLFYIVFSIYKEAVVFGLNNFKLLNPHSTRFLCDSAEADLGIKIIQEFFYDSWQTSGENYIDDLCDKKF